MKTRIMLDLETWGNSPGCVIAAIGAVKFGGGAVQDTFYQRVEMTSCVQAGLHLDASTVLWWMQQNDKARGEMCAPGAAFLKNALEDFTEWMVDRDAEIWGNGSDFDNAILAAAFKAARLNLPWKFWNNRCYRTVKSLHPEVQAENKNGHIALDDALNQAKHLMLLIPTL